MENNEYQDKLNEINARYEEERSELVTEYRRKFPKEKWEKPGYKPPLPPLPRGKRFDERQRLIRGSIFTRGMIITWFLILANSILVDQFDYAEAPDATYIIVMMLSVAYIVFEMCRRGAYFDLRGVGVLTLHGAAVVAAVYIVKYTVSMVKNDGFISGGKLTGDGIGVILFFIEVVMSVITIIYQRKWKKSQKEEYDDE